MSPRIFYSITPHCLKHEFAITLCISQPDPNGQLLSLPSWIPGSYLIRDFAKDIVDLSASNDGKSLRVTKQDKDTWLVEPCVGELVVSYHVYAWDISVRTAYLDHTRAFFNGTSVFLQVHGQEAVPHVVDLCTPADITANDWQVATSLAASDTPVDPAHLGQFVAPNYDELLDHPVEMGVFKRLEFEVAGVPHEMVFAGHQGCEHLNIDFPRIVKDVRLACEHHVALFTELPAIERYVFMTMVVGEGYGGLEHRASTALLCSYEDLPVIGETNVHDRYRNFLGLCSHEYFHTWNVKRIKPRAFVPYDYQKENYTQQLWAFEGITSYYDDYSLCRTSLVSAESYLELLGRVLTRLARNPGRLRQSVCESSFDAWTKFYKQNESAPNVLVSYYVKGAVIALMLDLKIRELSDGQQSLDDVMRYLWQTYGKDESGVPEIAGVDGVQQAVETLCPDAAWADFFASALHGVDDLSVEQQLAKFGVKLHWRASSGSADLGGKAGAVKSTPQLTVGARLVEVAGVLKVTQVLSDSPAEQAGLAAGDQLVAVNACRVKQATWGRLLERAQLGDQWQLHYFRRDELLETTLVVGEAPLDTCYLTLQEGDKMDVSSLNHRQDWLGV